MGGEPLLAAAQLLVEFVDDQVDGLVEVASRDSGAQKVVADMHVQRGHLGGVEALATVEVELQPGIDDAIEVPVEPAELGLSVVPEGLVQGDVMRVDGYVHRLLEKYMGMMLSRYSYRIEATTEARDARRAGSTTASRQPRKITTTTAPMTPQGTE